MRDTRRNSDVLLVKKCFFERKMVISYFFTLLNEHRNQLESTHFFGSLLPGPSHPDFFWDVSRFYVVIFNQTNKPKKDTMKEVDFGIHVPMKFIKIIAEHALEHVKTKWEKKGEKRKQIELINLSCVCVCVTVVVLLGVCFFFCFFFNFSNNQSLSTFT